jgi:hypothetical protein
MKMEMKTLTPVSDAIYGGEGATTFIPIKWDFVLLIKEE